MLVAVFDVTHEFADKQIPLSGLIRESAYKPIKPSPARKSASIHHALIPLPHIFFVLRRHHHFHLFNALDIVGIPISLDIVI